MGFDPNEPDVEQPELSTPDGFSVPDDYAAGVSKGKDNPGGFYSAAFYVDDLQNALSSGSSYATIPMSTIGAGGTYRFGNGTVTSPAISWQNETNSGTYRIGSFDIGESINGTLVYDWNASRLKLASAYSLYLGATTDPFATSRLAIVEGLSGPLRATLKNTTAVGNDYVTWSTMSNELNDCSLGIMNTSWGGAPEVAGEGFLVMSNGNGAGPGGRGLFILNRLNSYIRFGTNGTEIARFLSSGNFGIADTNPARLFTVTKTVGPQVRIGYNTAAYFEISSDSAGNVTLSTSGTGANGFITLSANIGFNFTASNAVTATPLGELLQASTGDAGLRWTLTGGNSYVAGIDNSDGDAWKLSYGSTGNAALGTNDYIKVTTAGAVTFSGAVTFGTFTQGSVLFAGAGGALTEDNANFFWNDASNFFGVATATPRVRIDSLSTTAAQFRATYTDNSVYADFQVDSGGVLSLTTTGNSVKVPYLTSGRITTATTGGKLTDSANLTWDGTGVTVTDNTGGFMLNFARTSATARTWAFLIDSSGFLRLYNVTGSDSHTTYDGTNQRTGFHTITPRRIMDILAQGVPQIRFTYTDNSVYSEIETTSSGNMILTSTNQVAFGSGALATNATVGFPCVQSCAGAPSGAPANIPTGQIPMVYDSTNNKIYFSNGSWRGVTVT